MQSGPLGDFFGYFPKVTEMAELLRLCDMIITPLLSYNVGPFKGFFVLVFLYLNCSTSTLLKGRQIMSRNVNKITLCNDAIWNVLTQQIAKNRNTNTCRKLISKAEGGRLYRRQDFNWRIDIPFVGPSEMTFVGPSEMTFVGPSEMTFGPIKVGKLRNVISHSVIFTIRRWNILCFAGNAHVQAFYRYVNYTSTVEQTYPAPTS